MICVFGTKAGKEKSIKPGDKRRISLLNSDFKILTGIEALRFKKISNHIIDPDQLVAASNARIHHSINKICDVIDVVGRKKSGAGVLDLDFRAGFDFLCLKFVRSVLRKKGVCEAVLERLERLYIRGTTRVSVNNFLGSPIKNIMQSLCQGDLSMLWFILAMDPLLKSLKHLLRGIVIWTVQVEGPLEEGKLGPLLLKETFVVCGYADDVKPMVNNMDEVKIIVEQCTKLEKASGVKLHRNPQSGKCKLLPLGKWIDKLNQNMVPYDFIKLTNTLDMMV